MELKEHGRCGSMDLITAAKKLEILEKGFPLGPARLLQPLAGTEKQDT